MLVQAGDKKKAGRIDIIARCIRLCIPDFVPIGVAIIFGTWD
jgi:hypothetical protein